MSRRAALGPLAVLLALALGALGLLAGVGSADAANPVPKAPTFGAFADAFPHYEAPTLCKTTTQPGTNALKALIAATYPTRTSFGTLRACTGATATSDHQEGRALDWLLNASDAGDRALAATFLGWLFATDSHGNTYANARRLGIAYIIWNRQMWRAYDVAAGWQPYTGTVPHTDHIHLSLSWAGAGQQTTWWHPLLSMNSPCDPATMHCNADGTVDAYTTPGHHIVNGREWQTTCSAYATGTRCFAYIKATKVTWNGRAYVVSTGWVFNNLTYVDTASAGWDSNMLAIPGLHVSAGRQWKVVCNPAASTGPRTCTDSIWATSILRVAASTGYRYVTVNGWVFNSLVRLHAA